MIELDGTPNKGKLGANAILGVSLAAAHATAARLLDVPLYRYLGGSARERCRSRCSTSSTAASTLANSTDFQEFMVAPVGATSFAEASAQLRGLRGPHAVLHDAGFATGQGDEGGFAPTLPSNEAAIEVVSGDREGRLQAGRRRRHRPRPGHESMLVEGTGSGDVTGRYRLEARAARSTPAR